MCRRRDRGKVEVMGTGDEHWRRYGIYGINMPGLSRLKQI